MYHGPGARLFELLERDVHEPAQANVGDDTSAKLTLAYTVADGPDTPAAMAESVACMIIDADGPDLTDLSFGGTVSEAREVRAVSSHCARPCSRSDRLCR